MVITTTPFTRHRMPVGFGPAPGPRQKADGAEWAAEETGTMRQEFLSIQFLGRPGQLERLLPPGFSLRGDPVVTVQIGFFRDLYWLAGRGYGVLHPLIPVTYTGKTETIEGNYMPVIWEGLTDAVITGRDELGFPKLAADIPDFAVDLPNGRVSGAASWLGFEFFSAELAGLAEVRDARPAAGDPLLTFKYVPCTSPHGAGGADIAHVTTGAAPPNGSQPGAAPDRVPAYRRWAGSGTFTWNRAKFEQLPTTFHVINGLADLDVVEYRGAAYFQAELPGHVISGDTQRSVEPAGDLRHQEFLPAPVQLGAAPAAVVLGARGPGGPDGRRSSRGVSLPGGQRAGRAVTGGPRQEQAAAIVHAQVADGTLRPGQAAPSGVLHGIHAKKRPEDLPG